MYKKKINKVLYHLNLRKRKGQNWRYLNMGIEYFWRCRKSLKNSTEKYKFQVLWTLHCVSYWRKWSGYDYCLPYDQKKSSWAILLTKESPNDRQLIVVKWWKHPPLFDLWSRATSWQKASLGANVYFPTSIMDMNIWNRM